MLGRGLALELKPSTSRLRTGWEGLSPSAEAEPPPEVSGCWTSIGSGALPVCASAVQCHICTPSPATGTNAGGSKGRSWLRVLLL